jgi:hypothetical protein
MQHVADNPSLLTDDVLTVPVHELVSRTLFEIANDATTSDPNTLNRANRARDMIFDRMVGKRRSGPPLTANEEVLEFTDLTGIDP